MDKFQEFENIVKYIRGEITYHQLGDILLGGKNINFSNHDNYEKYKQEGLKFLKDSEFFQYLIDNNCLVEALNKYKRELSEYLDERSTFFAGDEEATRKQLIDIITSLPDKNKLEIFNYREEEEDSEYEGVLYNPITLSMDNNVLKMIIISLSEEERIKFLIDSQNTSIHFRRLDKDSRIEIFNSLSETNKLRIFSEYTTITYEEWTTKYIPFLKDSRFRIRINR